MVKVFTAKEWAEKFLLSVAKLSSMRHTNAERLSLPGRLSARQLSWALSVSALRQTVSSQRLCIACTVTQCSGAGLGLASTASRLEITMVR